MMVDRYRNLAGPEYIDPSASQFETGATDAAKQLSETFRAFTNKGLDVAGTVFAQRAAERGTADGASGQGGLQKGFNEFSKTGAAYNNAFETSYVAKTQLDIAETLGKFKLEHENDPAGYQARVDNYSQTLAKATPPSLWPRVESSLRSAAIGDNEQLSAGLLAKQKSGQLAAQIAGEAAQLANVGSALKGANGDEAIGAAMGDNRAKLQKLIDDNVISPADGAQRMVAFENNLLKQVQAAHIDNYADPIISQIRADTIDGAKALDAFQQRADVPEDVKADVVTKVNAARSGFEAERQRLLAVPVSEIDQSIAHGDYSEALDAKILGAYRAGGLSDGGMQSRRAALIRNQMEGAKKDTHFQLADARIKAGLPADPGDPEMVKGYNEWFDRGLAMSGATPGTPTYAQQAADFTKKTNVLPASVLSFIRTSVVSQSGDPMVDSVRAAAAVSLYKSLNNAQTGNPAALQYNADQKQMSFLDQMARQLDSNTPVLTAYNTAYKNVYGLKPEEKQLLDREYIKQTTGKANSTRNLRSFQGALNERDDLSALDQPTLFRMRAENEALVAAEFRTNGGDLAAAQEVANKRTIGNWGESNITGKPSVVHYPPERLYGVTAQDIEATKQKQLKEAGYYFAPERIAIREIPGVTEESMGRTWQMVELNNAGDEHPLLGRDNQPVFFNIEGQDEYRKMYQERVSTEIEKRKAERATWDTENKSRVEAMDMEQLMEMQGKGTAVE